jgi:hypothetical protein
MHAGTFGEIIIKVLGLAFAFWGLNRLFWTFYFLMSSDHPLPTGYWLAASPHVMNIAAGTLMFCFARKISYRVLNHGLSMPARDQELDVREFLNEMILFGLGTYFCVDGVIKILQETTSIVSELSSDPGVVQNIHYATLVSAFGEFIIAMVLILGRRPILRFVTSFRTKEYGKKR